MGARVCKRLGGGARFIGGARLMGWQAQPGIASTNRESERAKERERERENEQREKEQRERERERKREREKNTKRIDKYSRSGQGRRGSCTVPNALIFVWRRRGGGHRAEARQHTSRAASSSLRQTSSPCTGARSTDWCTDNHLARRRHVQTAVGDRVATARQRRRHLVKRALRHDREKTCARDKTP